MGFRITVQADSAAEVAAGWAWIRAGGSIVAQPALELAPGRWMSRAVPDMPAAPAGEGQGREGQAPGSVSPHPP